MNDQELLRKFSSQCCNAQFTRRPQPDRYGNPTIVNYCDYCDEECCLVNNNPVDHPLPPEEVERLQAIA